MMQNNDRSAMDKNSRVVAEQLAWNLDWNLLRSFMVIAEFKSITQAAHHLNLKQPTLSNALKRLEDHLGFQLAERGPRNFKMTDHGEMLYLECKEIFGSIDRLTNIVQAPQDNVQGNISIAMASHVMTDILDDSLREFHQKNPLATFSISVKGSQEVIETVQAKQATLGICLIREPVADLRVELFYREHFGFFCGKGHALFGKKVADIQALKGQQIVSFYTDKLGDVLHEIAVQRGQAQLSDTITGLSNNLEEVRRMITAGLGIGPLPIHVVEADVHKGKLWRLANNTQPAAIDVFTIQHPKAILNTAEKEFIKLLTTNIANTPINDRIYGLNSSSKGKAK